MSAKSVTIVEMSLRDGLQNEKVVLSREARVEFAQRLAKTGLKRIEAGAFVRADWVPQMAGSTEVIKDLHALQKSGKIANDVRFSALVPNENGMRLAIEAGVKEIAIFAACSESFSKKNMNVSIDKSFERFLPVLKMAREKKIKVRGYLSVCFGCPFEGEVPEARVIKLARRMADLGVYEISVGDTVGVADPEQVKSLFKKMSKHIPLKKLAGHFHDTRGLALSNIYAAWELGMNVFDVSLGGLGGCPYAPGATGNVSTEDVIYMFERMNVKTGVSLDRLLEINSWVAKKVEHSLPSKVGKAGRLKPLGAVV